MNRRTLAIALALAPLAACGDDTPTWTPPPPSDFELERPELVADRTEIDFGEVGHGALVTAGFDIEVTGEHPLVIRAFNRSCGCADVAMVVLEPDGSTTPVELEQAYPVGTKFHLEGTFNTVEKRGEQRQYVQIDARNTEQTFLYHILCDVKSFFEEAPLALEVEGASSLGHGSGTRRVTTLDGSAVQLRRGDDKLEWLDLALVPVNPNDDGRSPVWDVTVTVKPGIPRGKIEGKLELITDVPQPEATQRPEAERFHREFLYVRGDVQGAVRLEPDKLEIPAPKPGQRLSRRVLVRNDLADWQLPAATAELAAYAAERLPFERNDAVTVEVRELEPGKLWQIELTADGDAAAGQAIRGFVVLPIDHPLERLVQLPFLVQPKRK